VAHVEDFEGVALLTDAAAQTQEQGCVILSVDVDSQCIGVGVGPECCDAGLSSIYWQRHLPLVASSMMANRVHCRV
jgi:hypothetical protein